jgi:neutral ceramidase
MAASTGVHDELSVRALVLGDGLHSAAVVCLDLIGLDLGLSQAIRTAVAQEAGLDMVLLCCSHTHSAPFTIPWSALYWEEYQRAGGPWRESVLAATAGCVREAVGRAREVRARVARSCVQVGVNRRLPTGEGIRMAPNPQGPVVPWVDVLSLETLEGAPAAVLFSHAAHPVAVHRASTLVSADYPGVAVAEVERRVGGAAMFAQGCCGDINVEPLAGGFEAAASAGRALGEAVVRAVEIGRPLALVRGTGGGLLRLGSQTRSLEFQELPSRQICQRAREEAVAQAETAELPGAVPPGRDYLPCLERLLARVEAGQPLEPLAFEASSLALGGAFCLTALTHEVFADYQLWAEAASPFPHNMVVAYTNGCESYVPTDAAIGQGLAAGYEAAPAPRGSCLYYRQRTALATGAEGNIKQALLSLWRQVHR